MDFTFGEDQRAVADLAALVIGDGAGVERVKEVEGSLARVDEALWERLAETGLLGIALPAEHGGSGLGLVEACLVLEQQGRHVAPVPLLPTVVLGAMPLARFGGGALRGRWLPDVVAGAAVLTAALDEPGASPPWEPATAAAAEAGGWTVHGVKVAVPAAHVAARILVPAATPDGDVVLLVLDPRQDGVELRVAETTNRELQATVVLDGARVDDDDVLAGPHEGAAAVRWLTERALVAVAALQLGVAEEALRMAAEHTSTRHQFGRPLSTFQAVALRAADGYIDTSAMRTTLWQAAWRLDAGLPAEREVLVAKWWSAEAGQRVVHATQHLHGGVGADVDHPVHRYFLWGKQLENTLGGASLHLARLGRALADRGGER